MVADGITVVVSTSYLDEAERCDRVAMLDQGRVLALDRPQTLQRSLEGTMLALRPDRPREAQVVLRALPGVRSAALFGDVVHTLLAPGSDLSAPGGALSEAGIALLESEEIEPSLEDVFIHLVGDVRTGAEAARV
jgi:ABC-2 type transport system ATP-binding protein